MSFQFFKIPEEGYSKEYLLKEIKQRELKDVQFPKVVSTMCTTPFKEVLEFYHNFLSKNLGDPETFQEQRVLRMKLF